MGNLTFRHAGATGDMIFALPTIKAMGGGTLYIENFHRQRAESIAPLIKAQPYIDDVLIVDKAPAGCVNLNLFRLYADYHKNIVEAHMIAHGIKDDSWRDGWLTVEKEIEVGKLQPYSVINLGANYLDPNFDWKAEVDYLLTISNVVYFIGYKEEYYKFQLQFDTPAKYFECDFMQAALLIKHAEMFTGGYSAMSTIAMGLGRKYRLVQAPGHTCSSLLMERETIVNLSTWTP